MNMDEIKVSEHINYWLESSKKDLTVMDHLYEKKDYSYALFFGHLLLEKVLKALFLKKKKSIPPYKHSLPLLIEKIGLKIDEKQESFLEEVSDFNIEARYPDIKFSFYKKCTKLYTDGKIREIKEFYKWIKSII